MAGVTQSTGCSVEGCEKPHKARALCHMHYMRQRRHGGTSVVLTYRSQTGICDVDGCEKPHATGGFCSMHWQRYRKTGDPGPAERLTAQYGPDSVCAAPGCERFPQRHWLCEMHADRMDDCGELGPAHAKKGPAGSGHARKDGYVEVRLPDDHPLSRGGRTLRHRVVLWEKIGPGPHACNWCGRQVDWGYGINMENLIVDHVDLDPTNNAPENLTPSCNSCNPKRRRR